MKDDVCILMIRCEMKTFLFHFLCVIYLFTETPSQPGRPVISQVSSCDVILLWEPPENDGYSDIINYRVDYRQSGKLLHMEYTYIHLLKDIFKYTLFSEIAMKNLNPEFLINLSTSVSVSFLK